MLKSYVNYLRSIRVLPVPKESVEFPHEELIGTPQIVSHGKPEGNVWILEIPVDVVDDVLFIEADREHLAFPVDTDDPVRRLMRGRHEDGLRTDPVHVDADPALHVVQMNVAVLGDQVGDTMLLTHLSRRREKKKMEDFFLLRSEDRRSNSG